MSDAVAVKVAVSESVTNGSGALKLRLDDVKFEGKDVVGVRLFVNKPDVSSTTPTTDAAYVGSVSPGHLVDNKATNAFVIDVSTLKSPAREALTSSASAGKAKLYGVPVMRNSKVAEKNEGVSIGRAELERKDKLQ